MGQQEVRAKGVAVAPAFLPVVAVVEQVDVAAREGKAAKEAARASRCSRSPR
jgi:hypothetical protein